ncbi:hypothetical protein IFM89_013039 [Coptis chinensis]|uniref:DUF4218 domain-containing protein n=1 Tax=Coptis chinensis TaxID=261450 RepID=A0A835GVZ3_9MAGN|nr:hypothetical protein IFM89_013039 [Coptis chinensis]
MMKTYKSYVGNPKFPEGCIAEQYLMDEAMKYCMEYIPSSKREIHKQEEKAALDDKNECGYPIDKKGKDYLLPSLQYQQARKWVLRKSSKNVEWERKYETYLQSFKSKGKSHRVIASSEKEMEYIPWLRKQLEKEKESKLKMFADGPSFIAKFESVMSQTGSDQPSDYQLDFEPSDSEEIEEQHTGPKKEVRFNYNGLPVGPGSTQFVTFIGKMARMYCAPILPTALLCGGYQETRF